MSTTSSASRLLALIERAQSTQTGANAFDGWAKVFEIAESRTHHRDREVVRLVGMLHDQLTVVREQLEKSGKNMARFNAGLKGAEAMLSISKLSESWTSTLARIDVSTIPVLGTVAEFLPKETATIDDADLIALRDELSTWQTRTDESDLPDAIKRFLGQQIDLIARAIREYPIRGPEAFQAASMEAAVAWATHEETVAPYRNRPEVVGVKGLWPKIVKIAKMAVVIHSLLTTVDADVHQAARIVRSWRELTGGANMRALPAGDSSNIEGVDDIATNDTREGPV